MSQLPAKPPGARGLVQANPAGRALARRLQHSTYWVDKLTERLLPYDPDNQHSPDQRARPMILVGLLLFFVLFGVIGLWAGLVPLETGAIAPGRVVNESSSKTIQHLEGGIVKEILVREGEAVAVGDVLVRLENVSAEARNEQVRKQFVTAKASEARLIAERDGKTEVTFPPELMVREKDDMLVKEALDTQRRLFAAHKAAIEGQIEVLNQKMAQSEQEINGLNQQAEAADQQIGLLGQEIDVVRGLLKTGNATKPRLLALERQQAQLKGQRGQSKSLAARANQAIQESKIAIANTRNEALNAAVKELKDVQTQLGALEEQGRASADVVRRIELKAPIAGTVTGLQVHTVGGVVQPGGTLMTLVPAGDRLIVEARVQPQDIDVVHPELRAQVRITAFKNRYLRPLEGRVITVSADRFDEPRTGESYYLARIEIPPSELTHLKGMHLTPGMGAEALIVTGSRTMLSYLLQPIRESFSHAFHDQ